MKRNYYLIARLHGGRENFALVKADEQRLLRPNDGRWIRWLGSEHSVNEAEIVDRHGLEFTVQSVDGPDPEDGRRCCIPIERIVEIEMTPEEASKLFE